MELATDLMMELEKEGGNKKTNTLWAGESVSFQGEIEASNWSAE